MDNQSNVSVVILIPYTFTSVSITIIILQVIGIVFNAAFILITRKGDTKVTDRTLLLASITQIGQGLVTITKFIFVLACKDNETALQWYFIFEPLDFLCCGLYIWLSLSLTTARYFVVKKIEIPNNNPILNRSKIRQWLPFPIVLVASCIFLMMITMDVPDISRYFTVSFLQIAVIGIPMFSFVIFTVFLILYTLKVVFKRRNGIGHYSVRSTCSKQRSQPSVTSRLLQQAIYSLLYHIVFMALPYSYVVATDVCIDIWFSECDILRNQKLFFHYTLAVLPIFNPISLGFFLKQHRKSLKSFWKAMQILLAQQGKQSLQPIPESQEFQLVQQERNSSIEGQKRGPKEIPSRIFTKTSACSDCSISRHSSLASKDPLYFLPDSPFFQSDLENDTISVFNGSPYDDRRASFLSNLTGPSAFVKRHKLSKQSTYSIRSNHSKDKLSIVSITSIASSSGQRVSLGVNSSNQYKHSIASILSIQSAEDLVKDTCIYF
ncbi:unnamed protein product [Mytilus coruscus]|uniref:Uncharacterized protein n=1 Tax=Mytilus coruscus TaxID=42192 RepID=A0A6J8EIY9_MYTCO|nr:unnamed protein product [Mytilus coruscus]